MGAYAARASKPGALAAAARAPRGVIAAAVGVAVWLLVDPRTPDLAAQVYRANLWSESGWLVWDSRWYAGHDIPGYSLVFPPLGALVGVRTVGALAVLASAALFEKIVLAFYGSPAHGSVAYGSAAHGSPVHGSVPHGSAARWAAVWFALAALGDVWSGRITFALGVTFALGAVLALMRRHSAAAALLAAACATCSPVAGVLLALAALTHTATTRSARALLVLGVPAVAVAVVLAGLFGEGGWEPFPLLSFLATAAVVAGFLAALPRKRELLWVGGWIYLAACVACVAAHSPMGANVERYGVLLAGPLLLCAVLGGRGDGAVAPADARRPLTNAVAAAALAGIAVWTVWGPVRETEAVAGNPSTTAAYYAPVARYVAGAEARTGRPVRVEVPFTRSHWEAAWLAPRVMLARGWEKQLDERYDGVLLARHLTAAAYRRWLDTEAVDYVALPDAPLDPSSAAEGRLIAAGLPYLRLAKRTRHWRIYAVRDPTPLARGPGVLSGVGHDWFSLRARAGGRFLVRVRYTRYFTVVGGAGCVEAGPGGFTAVGVSHAGTVRVQARFSLARALGLAGRSCRG